MIKAITYKSSIPVLSGGRPKRFEIEIRTYYLFSMTTNDLLKDYIKLYHDDQDDTVFLIPEKLKSLFLELFGKLTEDKPTVLSENHYNDSDLGGPEQANEVKEEIVKRGGNNISPSPITFVETIKEYDMFEELQKLLDSITREESNAVDAIFVTLTTDATEPFLVQSSTLDPNRKVDIKSYGGQIGRFEELRKRMDPSGVGLKGATFHFRKGVTSITRLGEKRPLYVFFVSTADNALADVDWVKQTYLPDIEKHLKNIKKID